MKFANFARMAPALALVACAAPKAIVVEAPNAAKKEQAVEPNVPEPAMPPQKDDGIRLPDMLTMPGDSEFRATSPDVSKPGSGAVISRPPTDPPSRPKTKEPGGQ